MNSMNKKTPQQIKLTRAATWLAAYAALLVAIWGAPVYAEDKTVVASGDSFVCYKREEAIDLAKFYARDNGTAECRKLGPSWRFTGTLNQGFLECRQCGSSKETKCWIKEASFKCTSMEKENKEKAEKKRAEKEAADLLEKAKVAREKAEREVP